MTTTTTTVVKVAVAAEEVLRLLEMERCTCRMDAKGEKQLQLQEQQVEPVRCCPPRYRRSTRILNPCSVS